MQLFLLLFMIIEIAFGMLVIKSGLEMIKINSLKKELDGYRTTNQNSTFVKDWMFGWRFSPGRTWSTMMINSFGDKTISLCYRIGGYLFFVLSLVFFLAPIAQLALLLKL